MENSTRAAHDLQASKFFVDFPPDCQETSFCDVVDSFCRNKIQVLGRRAAQNYLVPSILQAHGCMQCVQDAAFATVILQYLVA